MAVAAVVAACVAACGSSSTPSSTTTSATATGVAGSPVNVALGNQPSGAVTLSWDPQTKNVSAKLQMVGFTPGSSHAMHIHQGSCASQGDVLVPFPDVTANDGGAIDTTVTSSQPSAAGLAAGTFLNIHLAPAAQLGGPGSLGYTPISCADITPAAPTTVTMAPPPQPGQHPQGSATLTYDPAKHTLTVSATASGLVAGSDHAVHIHLGSCDSQGAWSSTHSTIWWPRPPVPPRRLRSSRMSIRPHRRRAGTSTSTSDRPARSNKMGSPPFISSRSSAATSASSFQHRPAHTAGMAPSRRAPHMVSASVATKAGGGKRTASARRSLLHNLSWRSGLVVVRRVEFDLFGPTGGRVLTESAAQRIEDCQALSHQAGGYLAEPVGAVEDCQVCP